ncbi:MAG: toxic anion resistance protein, partial [Clostridiales Family XIII bacterium]|nr:toxic anion resistance protein [Clostridiales Family XIII bacterium]
FSKQIDIHSSTVILQYGSGAQTKMGEFSQNALNGVRTKDMGEIGGMITGLVTQLKSFDVTEEKGGGFLGLFKKGANKVTALKARYATAEQNVAQIAGALEQHQHTLMKDVAMLDKMYEQNVVYFKELTMYILAGKRKLADAEQTELPALRTKAQQSGLPEDAQAANDFANQIDRFSKKLYDLELTRTISLQMAPQIRMIQNNDTLMTEKIQSTLVNTIPLWKSQMVLALGVEHSQQAARAQREVSDMTNELLRKNSETLKIATVETAKESERGIVDIETLQLTNRNLIETLDEVVRIQTEGRQKRADAEVELARIENELKEELLKLRG